MADQEPGGLLEAMRLGGATSSSSPSSFGLPQGDAEDALSVDIAAARAAAQATDTATANEVLQEALKKRYQVDLGQEVNAQNLEDPTLVQHIAEQRAALREQGLAAPPAREALTLRHSKCKQLNSAALQALDAGSTALRNLTDELETRCGHVTALAHGSKPHGFPVAPEGALAGAAPSLLYLNRELLSIVSRLTETSELLTKSLRDFTVVRREAEAVADGRERLLDAPRESP
jgi:hypothetical protein